MRTRTIRPRYEHPKDGRVDLKQIQTGRGVTADGGIPVYWKVHDGGAAEVSQVEAAMSAIRGLAVIYSEPPRVEVHHHRPRRSTGQTRPAHTRPTGEILRPTGSLINPRRTYGRGH
jgi:hypothetical protein